MWSLSFAHMFALAIAATAAEPSEDMALPKPISSRQTYFSIPFRVDQPSTPVSGAAAVQLHVSTDRGKTWSQYASVLPTLAHFLFRAPHDGEYWFGVRTLDQSKQLRPTEIVRPGLIVIVDTSPPKLALQAQHGDSGLVTASWQVAEQRLDRNSLAILYRSGPNLPWLAVAIQKEEADSTESAWSGSVSWMPVGGPGPLEIRAEISDTSGNRDISHTQVAFDRNLDRLAASASSGAQPAPDTSAIGPHADTRWATSGRPPASNLGEEPASEDRSRGWHTATREAAARGIASNSQGGNPASHGKSDPSMSGLIENGGSYPDRSIAATSNPPIRNKFITSSSDTQVSPARQDASPPRSRSRMVNSRSFELGYDLDAAGRGNPARVELWGTRDEGRTWRSYGVDKDGRSPILATVEAEGTYGFRVAVSSSRDPVGQSPRPGDPPDMLVTVDLTDPVARILAAEQASYNPPGQITVRWDAADARLAQRPISLYYAAYPEGPWNPVVQDLENNRQYEWLARGNLPGQIFLRLEVRDEAGNVGISATTEPMVLINGRPGSNVILREDESARMPHQ